MVTNEPTATQRNFADDLRESVLSLRSALVELYREVGADPARPQEVARQFGLNKNLTWKIAKVIDSEDAFEAAPLIPGPEGLGILLNGLRHKRRDGHDSTALERVRHAATQFEAMVARHTGDRATLDLLLDGAASSRSLEVSRKLAFRGNSGLWGLQARARLTAHVLAPNADDPSRIDIVLITGLLDLFRLRQVVHWPLFRFYRYTDDASIVTQPTLAEPIEPPTAPDAPQWIMPSWCSTPTPTLTTVAGEHNVTHYLGDGPIGRMGQFTYFCGLVERGTESRYGDTSNEYGEVGTHVTLPIETLVMDLFVHRELTEAMHPEACVFGRAAGDSFTNLAERDKQRLPTVETPIPLGERPPRIATPLMPEYERRISETFPRLGFDMRDFAAFRFTLQYPPMPSLVVLRHRLPQRAN